MPYPLYLRFQSRFPMLFFSYFLVLILKKNILRVNAHRKHFSILAFFFVLFLFLFLKFKIFFGYFYEGETSSHDVSEYFCIKFETFLANAF